MEVMIEMIMGMQMDMMQRLNIATIKQNVRIIHLMVLPQYG